MAEDQSWDLKWELLVADTWDDDALKQRLLSDPETVFAERGIKAPDGVSLKVVEDTEDTVHLVLPPAPSEEELSEEELESVAGGHVSLCFSLSGGGCGGGCRSCSGCSGCSGRCSSCRSCSGCSGCGGGGGGGGRCRP